MKRTVSYFLSIKKRRYTSITVCAVILSLLITSCQPGEVPTITTTVDTVTEGSFYDGFRIMAPETAERTTFKKDRRPNPGTVFRRHPLDFKDRGL